MGSDEKVPIWSATGEEKVKSEVVAASALGGEAVGAIRDHEAPLMGEAVPPGAIEAFEAMAGEDPEENSWDSSSKMDNRPPDEAIQAPEAAVADDTKPGKIELHKVKAEEVKSEEANSDRKTTAAGILPESKTAGAIDMTDRASQDPHSQQHVPAGTGALMEVINDLRAQLESLHSQQNLARASQGPMDASDANLSPDELRQAMHQLRQERMAQQRLHYEYVTELEYKKTALEKRLSDAALAETAHATALSRLESALAAERTTSAELRTKLDMASRRTGPTSTTGLAALSDAITLPRTLLQHAETLHDSTAEAQWRALEMGVSGLVGTFITHRIAWYRLNRGAKDLLESVTPHYDEAENWDPDRAEDWSEHWRIALLQGCIWRVVHESIFESNAGFWAGEEGVHLEKLLEGLYKLHRNDPDAIYHFNKIRVSMIPYIKPLRNAEARADAVRDAAERVTLEFHRLINTGSFRNGREDMAPFKLSLMRLLETAARLRDMFVRSPASWTPVFPKPLGRGRRIDRRFMEITDPMPMSGRQDGMREASSRSGGGGGGDGGVRHNHIGRKRRVAVIPATDGTLVHRVGDGPQEGDKDAWVVAVVTPALIRHGGADGRWDPEDSRRGVAVVKAKVVCLPILPESEGEDEDEDEDEGEGEGGQGAAADDGRQDGQDAKPDDDLGKGTAGKKSKGRGKKGQGEKSQPDKCGNGKGQGRKDQDEQSSVQPDDDTSAATTRSRKRKACHETEPPPVDVSPMTTSKALSPPAPRSPSPKKRIKREPKPSPSPSPSPPAIIVAVPPPVTAKVKSEPAAGMAKSAELSVEKKLSVEKQQRLERIRRHREARNAASVTVIKIDDDD